MANSDQFGRQYRISHKPRLLDSWKHSGFLDSHSCICHPSQVYQGDPYPAVVSTTRDRKMIAESRAHSHVRESTSFVNVMVGTSTLDCMQMLKKRSPRSSWLPVLVVTCSVMQTTQSPVHSPKCHSAQSSSAAATQIRSSMLSWECTLSPDCSKKMKSLIHHCSFYGGGLIGAIIQSPICNRYGRRSGSLVGGILLVISGAIQAGSVHIAMFLIGRFICGVAAGIVISNCPVYMSEVSPAHKRGKLVSIHAITLVVGYIVSSLLALAFYFVNGPYQWRLQFVMLTAFAILLVISVHFLPESPRWLVEKRKYDAAWKVLERIHRSQHDPSATMAHAEMFQIRAQVDAERELPTGYIHIFKTPSLRRRAIISILVWCMGQGSGVLVVANLTPLIFKSLGFSIVQQLGLSIAWVTSCTVAISIASLFVDKVGRVKILGKNIS